MLKEFIENMEKSQSPRLTDSEYKKLLKRQKQEKKEDILAGVGFDILYILLLVITAIF